ncbi:MAG: hypothetical protein KKB37_09980 [Alphaproteobacteria bacterium]|nr:hypothetical protein [Alphaproteobacteria bacterium]
MPELQSPNLMRVAGLIIFSLGLVILAMVVTSFAHVASNDTERAELTANRRTVGMWFCLPVLLLGVLLQLAGEFVPRLPSASLTIFCLISAFWMLVYLMMGDWLAQRMLDLRQATEVRRRQKMLPPPVNTKSVDAAETVDAAQSIESIRLPIPMSTEA